MSSEIDNKFIWTKQKELDYKWQECLIKKKGGGSTKFGQMSVFFTLQIICNNLKRGGRE